MRDRGFASSSGLIGRPAFWLLLWIALEIGLIGLFAKRFGLGTVLLGLVLKSGVGLFGLGFLLTRAFARLPGHGFAPKRLLHMGFGVLAGVLLAMPGMVLTFAALLLLAPSIRALLAARFMRSAEAEDDGVVTLHADEWRDITPPTPEIASEPRERP